MLKKSGLMIEIYTVYVKQGYLQERRVAVKKLFTDEDFLEKKFQEELKCLKSVKHKNIVRFLGYCSETPKVPAKYNETTVMADDRRRVLCFEYAPNQSLQHYLEGNTATLLI
jgi:serine/threonine protein kinase